MRRLASASIVLLIGITFSQVLSAVGYWVAARELAPSDVGPLLGVVGIATLVASFSDFGFNASTIRAMAQRSAGDAGSFERTLSAKLFVGCGLFIIWTVACLLLTPLSSAWLAYACLGPFLAGSVIARALEVPFRARQQMGVVALTAGSERAMMAALTAVLIVGGIGIFALPVALSVSAVAAATFEWTLLRKEDRILTVPTLDGLRRLVKESFVLGLVGLLAQIQRVDVAIVALVSGPTAAGVFAVPARITGLLGIVPLALSSALFPYVAAETDQARNRRHVLIATGATTVVMVPILGGLFVAAPAVVSFLLGTSYAGSATVLRIILLGMLPASANGPIASALQGAGQERFVAATVGFGALAGLVGVALGASVAGAAGAAWGFVGFQFLALALLVSRLYGMGQPAVLPVGLRTETHSADS